MDSYFRGCHYHIEHSEISQKMIKLYFERVLERDFGAKRIPDKGQFLGIGSCNGRPENLSIWELRALIYVKGRGQFEFQSQSCVLWIGKFGKLHIESNKTQKYVYSILKKAEIIQILQNWQS